ncbi:MAG TPA: hypothetical protein VMW78_08270 [Anaerolineae bacterium]|nr:hypothetical protein [Anaerolineae bacterium]
MLSQLSQENIRSCGGGLVQRHTVRLAAVAIRQIINFDGIVKSLVYCVVVFFRLSICYMYAFDSKKSLCLVYETFYEFINFRLDIFFENKS